GHAGARVEAGDVLTGQEESLLERQWGDRRLLHDLLVELAPSDVGLLEILHRHDLVDAGVDGLVVDLREVAVALLDDVAPIDRQSTRLNSSHVSISYAVFCLK